MPDKTFYTCNIKLAQKFMTIFYDCQMERADDASPNQKQIRCLNQNITSPFFDSGIVTSRRSGDGGNGNNNNNNNHCCC